MADTNINRCSRCGRERPTEPPQEASAQGWTAFEDEHGNFLMQLCPGCHTADERIGGWPDYPPEEAI